MSSLLHPVGPRRPAVYWRRRVVLLLVVAGLVAAVLVLTGGLGQAEDAPAARAVPAAAPTVAPSPTGAPTGQPTDGSTADPTADPTGSPTQGGTAAACTSEQLAVTAATDAASYSPDGVPRLTVTVANTGTEPCEVDLGSADSVELVVVSGEDRIWSSDDCQQAAESRPVTLAPGGQEEQSVSWQRVRSAPGCPEGAGEPRPGTYQVTARVAEVTSAPAAFALG